MAKSCEICVQTNKLTFKNELDCFERALETLKSHYLFLKQNALKKDRQYEQLEERNEKLVKAVLLLQRENQQLKEEANENSKRRKIDLEQPQSPIACSPVSSNISDIDDVEQLSDLNIALNSQRLQDMSSCSMLQNSNEMIGETEKTPTSRIFRSNSTAQPQSSNRIAANSASWLFKPNAGNMKSDKRLKQTKLNLEQTRKESTADLHYKNTAALKSSKSCWSLKPDISSVPVNRAKTLRQLNENTIKPRDVSSKSDFFNFTRDTSQTKTAHEDCFFELRSDDTGIENTHERPLFDSSSQENRACLTPSVMVLSPVTQEVIFLNDTCEPEVKEKYPKKLIQHTSMFKDDTLDFTDRKIRTNKLQLPKANTNAVEIPSIKVKHEFAIPKKHTASKEKENIEAVAVKSQRQHAEYDEEESEDFMPVPIVVKVEKNIEDTRRPTKINIKKLYNIDCADCQQHLNYMRGTLTYKQIEDYLGKCRKHNDEFYMQQTPNGFWNPLMMSFAADDPRNEVLQHNKVDGKKRRV